MDVMDVIRGRKRGGKQRGSGRKEKEEEEEEEKKKENGTDSSRGATDPPPMIRALGQVNRGVAGASNSRRPNVQTNVAE